MLTRRNTLGCLLAFLFIAAMLAGCKNQETGKYYKDPTPSLLLPVTVQPGNQTTIQPSPTPIFYLGALIDPDLDLRAGPVELPIEIQIPSLKVTAPMVGVGLTKDNVMDAPKGDIGDPMWHTAFWYRGGGIPGDVGTATIAGHINDPLGRPEIFSKLDKLEPGDLIIIYDKATNNGIRFLVDQVVTYSVKESSEPKVLTKIYGAGPVNGTGPQPSPDGLSHLTLITCTGNIVDGQFDHHIVAFATRSDD